MNQALIGAIKRKNLKDVVEQILLSEGKEAEAKEVRDAGRLTTALIDRTCISKETETETETEESPETEEGAKKQTTTEKNTSAGEEATASVDEAKATGGSEDEGGEEEEEEAPRLTVGDIKALVATGKKKKIKEAKEAFKAQFAKDHPNYKELKKLFKKED